MLDIVFQCGFFRNITFKLLKQCIIVIVLLFQNMNTFKRLEKEFLNEKKTKVINATQVNNISKSNEILIWD